MKAKTALLRLVDWRSERKPEVAAAESKYLMGMGRQHWLSLIIEQVWSQQSPLHPQSASAIL